MFKWKVIVEFFKKYFYVRKSWAKKCPGKTKPIQDEAWALEQLAKVDPLGSIESIKAEREESLYQQLLDEASKDFAWDQLTAEEAKDMARKNNENLTAKDMVLVEQIEEMFSEYLIPDKEIIVRVHSEPEIRPRRYGEEVACRANDSKPVRENRIEDTFMGDTIAEPEVEVKFFGMGLSGFDIPVSPEHMTGQPIDEDVFIMPDPAEIVIYDPKPSDNEKSFTKDDEVSPKTGGKINRIYREDGKLAKEIHLPKEEGKDDE